MAFPDKLSDWVLWTAANRGKVLSYVRGLQIFAGLLLLLIGWHMGHAHLHLMRDGIRAQGKIVDSRTERFRSGTSGTTAYMPVVDFQAGDRTTRFTNWLGSSRSPTLNQIVPVLYDAADPSVAMIDRPVMNWIPWGPISAVGLFLLLVGIVGLLKRTPTERQSDRALR